MKAALTSLLISLAAASVAANREPPAAPVAAKPAEEVHYVEECSALPPPRDGELALPNDKAMGFEFAPRVF